MFLKDFWRSIDTKLRGQPDHIISALLIGTAMVGIAVALWGPRPVKLVMLGWWWAP